jgi:hypothetical protein
MTPSCFILQADIDFSRSRSSGWASALRATADGAEIALDVRGCSFTGFKTKVFVVLTYDLGALKHFPIWNTQNGTKGPHFFTRLSLKYPNYILIGYLPLFLYNRQQRFVFV